MAETPTVGNQSAVHPKQNKGRSSGTQHAVNSSKGMGINKDKDALNNVKGKGSSSMVVLSTEDRDLPGQVVSSFVKGKGSSSKVVLSTKDIASDKNKKEKHPHQLQQGEHDVSRAGLCRDSLDHYLHCECLWGLLSDCLSTELSSHNSRFGIASMSHVVVRRFAILFMAYHSLKAECYDDIAASRASLNYERVRKAFCLRLRAYASEYA